MSGFFAGWGSVSERRFRPRRGGRLLLGSVFSSPPQFKASWSVEVSVAVSVVVDEADEQRENSSHPAAIAGEEAVTTAGSSPSRATWREGDITSPPLSKRLTSSLYESSEMQLLLASLLTESSKLDVSLGTWRPCWARYSLKSLLSDLVLQATLPFSVICLSSSLTGDGSSTLEVSSNEGDLGRILSHFSSWLLEQTMTGARERGVMASMRILRGRFALAWLTGDSVSFSVQGGAGGSREAKVREEVLVSLSPGCGERRGAGVRGGRGGAL